jgi:hypothetical protein
MEWSTLPFLCKLLLLLSVSSMMISFFIFATAGGQTFHKVEVTTDYRKEPLNGARHIGLHTHTHTRIHTHTHTNQ